MNPKMLWLVLADFIWSFLWVLLKKSKQCDLVKVKKIASPWKIKKFLEHNNLLFVFSKSNISQKRYLCLGFGSLDISDRSLVNWAGLMVLFIMVTFDQISGKSAWSNHGLLWVKDTTSLAFSLPRTEQLLRGVTLELDGYLAFVVSPFITKSSSRWFWMHLLMRWLHKICSDSSRPLCLEHEQTAEWYEMSSAQAGLRISNQLGNEGWGGAGRQWAQCAVAKFRVEFLQSAWTTVSWKTRWTVGSVAENKISNAEMLRWSCCPFCNYLLSPH